MNLSLRISLVRAFRKVFGKLSPARFARRWAKKTLVVGPSQPVDGDSVASTKALLNMLRKSGREAYTLPTLAMYKQIAWILTSDDLHPSQALTSGSKSASKTEPETYSAQAQIDFVTPDLQAAYDALIKNWRPDEIVLIDGPRHKMGFDPRGVKVFTIDHHVEGDARDDADAYIQRAPSAGCLLIEHYGIYDPILAVSILTDTFWLRQNDPARAAHYLDMLVDHGMTDSQLADVQRQLMVKKDPSIVHAIHDAELRTTDDAVFAVLTTDGKELHRDVMSELGYFARHLCVVRADGYVSLKTNDRSIDLSVLARKFGGGGHSNVAACILKEMEPGATASPEARSAIVNRLYEAFMAVVGEQVRAA